MGSDGTIPREGPRTGSGSRPSRWTRPRSRNRRSPSSCRHRLSHRRRAAARPGALPQCRAARTAAGQPRLPHDRRAGGHARLPQLVVLGHRRLLAAPRRPGSSIKGRKDHPGRARRLRGCRGLRRLGRQGAAHRGGMGIRRPRRSRGRRIRLGRRAAPRGRHVANTWQGAFPWQNLAEDGHAGTCPVKSFPPNGYGLYEVCGNVWEWTTDWYAAPPRGGRPGEAVLLRCHNPRGRPWRRATTRASPVRIPRRVVKGGSFLCAPSYCRRYRPAARHAADDRDRRRATSAFAACAAAPADACHAAAPRGTRSGGLRRRAPRLPPTGRGRGDGRLPQGTAHLSRPRPPASRRSSPAGAGTPCVSQQVDLAQRSGRATSAGAHHHGQSC